MKKLLTTTAIVLTLAMAPFAVLAQNSEANVWKNSGPEVTSPTDRPASVNLNQSTDLSQISTSSGIINVICSGNLTEPVENLKSVTISSSFDRSDRITNEDNQSIWEYFTSDENDIKSTYPVELTLNEADTVNGLNDIKLTYPADSVSGEFTPGEANSRHAQIDMNVEHDDTSLEINVDTSTSRGTLTAENVGTNELDFQVPISCTLGK